MNKEVLKEYLAKYDEIKAEYAYLENVQDYLKEEKEKDCKEKDALHKEITIKKSSLYHEKWDELKNMKEFSNRTYYKTLIDLILAGLSMILVGCIGGRFMQNPEFTLVFSGIVCPVITVASLVTNYVKHRKDLKEIDDTEIKEVTSPEYEELMDDYTKSNERYKEVEASLKIVNDRLAKLGLVKLDVENLILCLFSTLKDIKRNKSNAAIPFATWLDVRDINGEPKLEMGPNLRKEK